MPADPIVYQDEAKPGTIRHSFTGLRASFPNTAIHQIIQDSFIPFRKELVMRSEFQANARWQMELVTLCQRGLNRFAKHIRLNTDRASAENRNKTLEERIDAQNEFIEKAIDGTTLEELANDRSATHADEMTQPAAIRISSITFDWTGEDANFPQPTPGRFPNSNGQLLIRGLDLLVVQMTQSNSADHPRTINEFDAAAWLTALADLYNLVKAAGENADPYYPTGIERAQLDSLWNADGALDPALSSGTGQQGDEATT